MRKSDIGTKIVLAVIILGFIITIGISVFHLCSPQFQTKTLGGDITVNLEPGLKLEEITWKDDDLWYLTRPMREDEFAETYTFQQQAVFGVFEGTVTIVESEKTEGD